MSTDNTGNTDTTQSKKQGAPRWMWIALISSLAINLLVVGIVGGAAWKWRHGGHWGGHGFGGPMAKYIRTLPDERRTEFRKVIREHFKKMRPQWRTVHEARNKVSESLKADPFDQATFEASMDALRSAEFSARKTMTPVLSDLASRLTPEERATFLKHHSRRHKWRRRHYEENMGLEKNDGDATSPPQEP